MAEIQCPLCGGKNWLPDGAEPKCFFCGSPLSPETDLAQDVQYAPLPEPETDDSPFVKQVLVVPFIDSSGETGDPAEMDAEAQFSRAQHTPHASVHYRMTELIDLPPKEVCSPEQLDRAKHRLRQWFLMNTVFISMVACLAMLAVYFNRTDSALVLPVGLSVFFSIPILCYISNYLCPDKAWKPEKSSEEISFGGWAESVVFFGACIAGGAGGFLGDLGLDLISGAVLAVAAGAGISALVHYVRRLLR